MVVGEVGRGLRWFGGRFRRGFEGGFIGRTGLTGLRGLKGKMGGRL